MTLDELDFDQRFAAAEALARDRRLDEALAAARGAVALRPDSAPACALAGGVLAALGRPLEALPLLERAYQLDPARPEVRNNLGAILRGLKRNEEALEHFTAALELAPGYIDARFNLAGALAAAERYAEAIPHFEGILSQLPSSAELRAGYGRALWKSDRLEDAIAALEHAIELDPGYPDAYAYYGNAQLERGHIDEAVAALEKAIALAPHRPDFLRFLADIRTSALRDDQVAWLEEVAASADASDDDRIEAGFALGLVYADRGERPRSLTHLIAANALRRRHIAYDEPATLASFERIAEIFDAEFLASRRGCGDPSPVPVFIFGMPRSGTTLIEQILASHPQVYAAGELTLFEETANRVLGGGTAVTPEAMLEASCERLRELGEAYAGALRAMAPQARLVTDKMPANLRFAGLIRIVLPNAKMIHARRDPLDTSLSCFTQYFGGDQPWAYDLAEIGRYYRAYARLMEHWRGVVAPEAMLEIDYETVVADFEAQARRIVAFCGLEWDPACLAFHRTRRPVKTASAAQVRKPLYASSVRKASGYGSLLDPLIAALGP